MSHLIYLAIHCVQCLFQYVVITNCVQCVFHRERTSEEQATYRSYFSIPIESILLLLYSSHKGIVVHRSPISSVRLIKCDVHQSPLCTFYKCTVHQSPVLHLYKGCTELHCWPSTVAPFYSGAPFVSYYFMLCDYMLLDNSTLSTILLPMWIRIADYLTASMKSKFLQLQIMLPPVDVFILLSRFSCIN